jgi:hypothetical protein
MSGNVNPTVVVLIVMIGAGACVLVGYAGYSAFTRGRVDPYESAMQRNDEQDGYMRELREKNYAMIRQEARGGPRRLMPTYQNGVQMKRETSSPEY